jgi:hypothetical protein
MDYIPNTGYPHLRRSQTAPSMIIVNKKAHKSAEAYIQYVEQFKISRNAPKQCISSYRRLNKNKSQFSLRYEDMKSSKIMRAPPSTPQICATTNNSPDDEDRIGSQMKGALPVHQETKSTMDGLDCSTTEDIVNGKEEITQNNAEIPSKRVDRAPDTKPAQTSPKCSIKSKSDGSNMNERKHIIDCGTAASTEKVAEQNMSTAPKREVLTIDLRPVVGDNVDDESDTIVSLHFEL